MQQPYYCYCTSRCQQCRAGVWWSKRKWPTRQAHDVLARKRSNLTLWYEKVLLGVIVPRRLILPAKAMTNSHQCCLCFYPVSSRRRKTSSSSEVRGNQHILVVGRKEGRCRKVRTQRKSWGGGQIRRIRIKCLVPPTPNTLGQIQFRWKLWTRILASKVQNPNKKWCFYKSENSCFADDLVSKCTT